GEFIAFYVAAGLMNGYVDSVLGAIPALIAGNQSLAKLHDIMTSGPPEPYTGTREMALDGDVTLSDGCFAYRYRAMLHQASLPLGPGTTVALVGPNGAGKSTILYLIMGFLRPRSGQLSTRGVPYDAIDMRALRRSIGVVMQRPALFAGTVLE